jgi:hypothetical protein
LLDQGRQVTKIARVVFLVPLLCFRFIRRILAVVLIEIFTSPSQSRFVSFP